MVTEWASMATAELINEYVLATNLAAEVADRRDRIEFALRVQMEQDGAQEAVSATHKATMKTQVRYDQSRLFSILEMLPEAELVDARAYIPEHDETRTVPASFNMTKLKPFSRRGRDIEAAIEGSKRNGATRLSVKPL